MYDAWVNRDIDNPRPREVCIDPRLLYYATFAVMKYGKPEAKKVLAGALRDSWTRVPANEAKKILDLMQLHVTTEYRLAGASDDVYFWAGLHEELDEL